MIEERLVDIETKIAFQEQAIKDLNDVVYEQQKKLDKLGAIVESLVQQNKELAKLSRQIDAPANEKPPHY
jgi:SlyX protein